MQGDHLKFRSQPGVTKAQLLQGEMLNLVFRQSRASLFVYAVLLPLMLFIYSHDVPAGWVWLWGGATLVATAWRLRLLMEYFKHPVYAEELQDWQRGFVFSLFLVGLCWGVPGVLFTPYLDQTDQIVASVVTIGLSGGSMAAFGHHRASHIAFSWPLLLPLAGYWLWQDGGAGMVIGLSLLLYLLLTTRSVSGFQQGLIEAMAVRYDQQTNIGKLTALTQRLDVANRALADKNALFGSLFNNSHQLMAYLDRQFNFVFVNEAYAAAGKRPANEYIGLNHFALYPDPENERLFRQVVETGRAYRADAKPFVHPDQPERGTTYWDVDLLPIQNAEGRVDGLLLSLFDVTEHVVALRQLTEREEYLATVLDAMHDGLCVSDARGRIVGVNPALCAMYGYSESELIGRDITGLIGGHDRARHAGYVQEHVAQHRKVLFRRVVMGQGVRKDGATFPVEVSLTETTVGGKQLFVALIRDVTERQTMIDQLEQALAELRQEKAKVLAANEELAFLSTHDSLTNLANRRHFDDFSGRLWRQAQRRHEWVAILLIDIDYFKQYNDHLGHQAGDACLTRVAEVLGREIGRAGDLVARYGGEEFIVLLGNTDVNGARHIAETVRSQVQALAIPHPGSNHGVITVSVGLAACVPGKGARIETLIGRADAALYVAKAAGRNRLEISNATSPGGCTVD